MQWRKAHGLNPARTFDLGRSKADPVTLLQDLIGCRRLAIDANQIVCRTALGDALLEQLRDSRAVCDLDVVREPSSVVIQIEDFQVTDLQMREGTDG